MKQIVVLMMVMFSSQYVVADTIEERVEALEKAVQELKELVTHPIRSDGLVSKGAPVYNISADCDKIVRRGFKIWNNDYEFIIIKKVECERQTFYLARLPRFNLFAMLDTEDTILFEH